jgi:two-component system osmolarity sensor histidine kinase EnvZ
MNKLFKKFTPKKILPRLLLIFLLPLILTQSLLIFLFYDRHWEKIITRFSNIASNQIAFLISEDKSSGYKVTQNSAIKLNLKFLKIKNYKDEIIKKKFFEKKIERKIKDRLGESFFLSIKENEIHVFKKEIDYFYLIKFPKKYLLSETPLILFLWMIFSSLIFTLIAFLFLRIQIRAIERLANSAKDFGDGKKIKKFKPEGAMEIRQAGSSFIQMKKKINNYIVQRTSFLTGISHDLGTILTRIKLRLELMDEDEEKQQIKNDLQTMEMVLKEYLDFSEKINVKRITSINIFNLIIEVTNSSNDLKKKTKISCPKNIFFKTDRNHLFRIIFNVCENASKYGENISIRAKKKSNSLFIDIEDDGPGIPDKFKKKVFKPFFKIDDSRNLNQGGSGLGLSIANELIKKLKGKIYLKDSKKKGAIFTISL